MSEGAQSIQVEPMVLTDIAEALPKTRVFAGTSFDSIRGIERAERVTAEAGTVLVEAGEPWRYYWIALQGEVRAERPEADGTWTVGGIAQAGEGFGEVPFLMGRDTSMFRLTAVQDSVFLRFTEQDFWTLLLCCPAVRKTVLADSAQRVQAYQV
jgi:CRP-like cAMP-binding protein